MNNPQEEPQKPIVNNQNPIQISGGISPETEKLLNKWLKMQIAQAYWGMATKIILVILFLISVVFSAAALGPLFSYFSTIQNLSNLGPKYGTQNQNPTQPPNPVNDIIKKLNP